MSSLPVEFIPPSPTPEMFELGVVAVTGILGGLFGRLSALFDEMDYSKFAIGFMIALNSVALYAVGFNLGRGDYIRTAAGVAFMAGTAFGFFGFRNRHV